MNPGIPGHMLADTGRRHSPVQKHFSQTRSDKITGIFVTGFGEIRF